MTTTTGEITIRPAHDFDDVATMLGPRKPGANVCWCLSHRLPAKQHTALVGEERGEFVRGLCARDVAPGVLAYDGDEVVGWAAVAPKADLPFARSRKIPSVDDLPVWSVWCLRVRAGYRKQGIARHLVPGATEYAVAQGAPAVEGYPVDNGSSRVDLTMAYVGTRSMFEAAGYTKVADTDAVSGGFPRVVMRHVP